MQSTPTQRFTFFSDFGIGSEVIALIDIDLGFISLAKSTVSKIELTEHGPVYILNSGHHVHEKYLVSADDSEGVKQLVMKELK